jgi:hypothetical protein
MRYLTILLLLLGASASALESDIAFGPTAHFGYTNYTISEISLGAGWKSKLDFPRDAFGARVAASLSEMPGQERGWAARLEGHLTVTDPRSAMTDKDWFILLPQPEFLFSDTTSSARGTEVGAGLWYERWFARRGHGSFRALAGYEFLFLTQEISGLAGWQIDVDTWDVYEFNEPGIRGLDYRAQYHLLSVGVGYSQTIGEALSFSLNPRLSWGHARDFDDHLLRFKTAESSGFGWGGAVEAELHYRLGNGSADSSFLKITGRMGYVGINGEQKQTWYGDDPAGPGDETGTVVTGIDARMELVDLSFGFSVGVPL